MRLQHELWVAKMRQREQLHSNVHCKLTEDTTVDAQSLPRNGSSPLVTVSLGTKHSIPFNHFPVSTAILHLFCHFFEPNSYNVRNLEILVGTNDLNKGGKYYKLKRTITHEQYNRPQFANDIGLIEVDGEIEYNENVQPIKYSDNEVPDDAEVQLTGWGRLSVSELFFFSLAIRFQFRKHNSYGAVFRYRVVELHQTNCKLSN